MRTALSWSVLNRHHAMLRELVARGAAAAPLQVRDGAMRHTHLAREPPLHAAVRLGDIVAAKTLLEAATGGEAARAQVDHAGRTAAELLVEMCKAGEASAGQATRAPAWPGEVDKEAWSRLLGMG